MLNTPHATCECRCIRILYNIHTSIVHERANGRIVTAHAPNTAIESKMCTTAVKYTLFFASKEDSKKKWIICVPARCLFFVLEFRCVPGCVTVCVYAAVHQFSFGFSRVFTFQVLNLNGSMPRPIAYIRNSTIYNVTQSTYNGIRLFQRMPKIYFDLLNSKYRIHWTYWPWKLHSKL